MSDAQTAPRKPAVTFSHTEDGVAESVAYCRCRAAEAVSLGDKLQYSLYADLLPVMAEWEKKLERDGVDRITYLAAMTGVAATVAAHALANTANGPSELFHFGPKVTAELSKRVMHIALDARGFEPFVAMPAGHA